MRRPRHLGGQSAFHEADVQEDLRTKSERVEAHESAYWQLERQVASKLSEAGEVHVESQKRDHEKSKGRWGLIKLTQEAKVSHEPSSTPKAFDLTVELTTPGEKNRLTTQTLAGIGLQHRLF